MIKFLLIFVMSCPFHIFLCEYFNYIYSWCAAYSNDPNDLCTDSSQMHDSLAQGLDYHLTQSNILASQAISRLPKFQRAVICDFLHHELFTEILCCTFKIPTSPSFILKHEQCMDLNTNLGKGKKNPGHFSHLAIHLLSWQPEERHLPPRSLIKQERIDNRCLLKEIVPEVERAGNKPQSAITTEEQQVGCILPCLPNGLSILLLKQYTLFL